MAFTPEDGNGKSDANSYVAVAFADTYWSDRGNSDWAALTEAQKQAALVLATDYLEANYRRTTGTVLNVNQALQFPAVSAYDPKHDTYYNDDEVPVEVQQATAILAKSSAVDDVDLNAPIDRLVSEEKVGPIMVKYSDSASSRQIQIQVDGLLLGIMDGGAASTGQIRTYRG